MRFPVSCPIHIVMIGCGGTGGHIAPHLYRLLYSVFRPSTVILCDGDNTEFPDFPLPRILLRCRVKSDRLSSFALGIADTGIITPDTQMYRCPFPNVNGFHLCTGSNQFTGYDTLWKLRSLPGRVISLPFGDDYYKPDCTKLNLSARDLFEHLKDREPTYYYSDVLIPMGKTVTDFIGGAL